MKCRICGNKESQEVFLVKEMMFGLRDEYEYFLCAACGCLQIAQPVTDPEKLYPSDYYSFSAGGGKSGFTGKLKRWIIRRAVASGLESGRTNSKIFEEIAQSLGVSSLRGNVKKEDKILEVGCGDGALIKALHELGFSHVTGIDPYIQSEIHVEGFELLKKDFLELSGHATYDVIMMHHSFEHMENPVEVLHHVKQLLSDNAKCIIRIPVADSFAFEQYRENWVQLDAPRHIFLHSNKSIDMLAARAGLKVREIVNDSTEFQFIGSEQYKAGIPLRDYRSYFVPFYKKLFFNRKHIFSAAQVQGYQQKAVEINKEGRGDQRVFYLVKS